MMSIPSISCALERDYKMLSCSTRKLLIPKACQEWALCFKVTLWGKSHGIPKTLWGASSKSYHSKSHLTGTLLSPTAPSKLKKMEWSLPQPQHNGPQKKLNQNHHKNHFSDWSYSLNVNWMQLKFILKSLAGVKAHSLQFVCCWDCTAGSFQQHSWHSQHQCSSALSQCEQERQALLFDIMGQLLVWRQSWINWPQIIKIFLKVENIKVTEVPKPSLGIPTILEPDASLVHASVLSQRLLTSELKLYST